MAQCLAPGSPHQGEPAPTVGFPALPPPPAASPRSRAPRPFPLSDALRQAGEQGLGRRMGSEPVLRGE